MPQQIDHMLGFSGFGSNDQNTFGTVLPQEERILNDFPYVLII